MGKIAGGALFALCLLLLFGVRVLAAPENLAGQEMIIDGITYEFAEGASYDMDEAVIACVTEISPDLEGEVAIPESITAESLDPDDQTAYPVKVLEAPGSFDTSPKNITSLTIPDSVEVIGQGVNFGRLSGLKELTIPGSVKVFQAMIQNASGLEKLTFAEGVEEISSNSMVSGCDRLKEISLPSTLKRITQPGTFSNCGVETIELPAGLEELSEGSTFSGCESLREVHLPACVTEIMSNTFSGCTSLEKVTADGTVTAIGSAAFNECTSLTEVPDFSEVTAITGSSAFKNCENLEYVNFSDKLTDLSCSNAFEGCGKLKGNIDLTNVTSIGKWAFVYCYDLNLTGDLSKVTSIGAYAFYYINLTGDINLTGVKDLNNKTGAFAHSSISSILLNDQVNVIPEKFLEGCENLTSLEIPDGVETIGDRAFAGCTGLETVEIGSGITSIGEAAFDGCTSLKTVIIHTSREAVSGLTVPEGVRVIYTVPSLEETDSRIAEGGPTIYEAVKEAVEGTPCVIRLEKNVMLDAGKLVIPAGKEIEITSEKEVYLFADRESYKDNTLIQVEDGASLTAGGQVIYEGGGVNASAAAEHLGRIVDCYGEMEIQGGTFQHVNTHVDDTHCGVIHLHGAGASLHMSGGSVSDNTLRMAGNAPVSGSVLVCDQAEFVMDGGRISENKAMEAYIMTPGVCVSGEAASFTMNDGGIAGNRGLFNGAVFVYGAKDQDESRSSFVLNGGEISGNRINEYRKNGSSDSGGAVSVYRASCFRMEGGKISDNVTYGDGGGVTVFDMGCETTEFVMNGGEISGNEAHKSNSGADAGCGGGIYCSAKRVYLNAGKIIGNMTSEHGGGLYIGTDDNGRYTAYLKDALITDNEAETVGGGIWVCPTGRVRLCASDGVAVFDNHVPDGIGYAGKDVAIVAALGAISHPSTLPERLPGGGRYLWYKDGHVSGPPGASVGTVQTNVPRFDPENPGEPETDLTDRTSGGSFVAVLDESQKETARKQAKLIISGNKAARGGGIGTNSSLTVGDGQMTEYSLTVNKVWDTEKQPDVQLPKSVKISLVIGDRVLDSITLTPDNGWSGTFIRIPDPDTLEGEEIQVREENVPEGFEVEYSKIVTDDENRTMAITVTNRALDPDVGSGGQEDSEEPGKADDSPAKKGEESIKTGDAGNIAGWMAALLVSVGAGVFALYIRRRNGNI